MPKIDQHAVPAAVAARGAPPPFRGFKSPNYTPVPDELFDELLVDLSGAELKAVLYIIRRTFGFKRERDNISLSQMLQGIQTRDGRVLDRGVGLSKKTLLLALRSLEDRGIILTERRQSAEKGNEPTAYCLHVVGSFPGDTPLGEESTPPLGEKLHQGGGGETTPSPRGKKYAIQETVEQNTARQETGEQQTAGSTRFDRFAMMRQDEGTSKFSKNSLTFAKTRGEASTLASPSPAGPTPVGQIIAQRRIKLHASTADGPAEVRLPVERPRAPDGDAPRSPRKALKAAARSASQVESLSAPSQPPGDAKRDRPPKLTPYLEDLIDRYSHELHDEEHLPQNRGQVARLWRSSGRSDAAFGRVLIDAKAITLERDIRKRAAVGGEFGARNKMPYYFTVLRDLLGMKDGRSEEGGGRDER